MKQLFITFLSSVLFIAAEVSVEQYQLQNGLTVMLNEDK